jgi:excisionase family DNA binding protein
MNAENATAAWEWLSVPEAAGRTGMSVGTLRRLLNSGAIPSVQLGSRNGRKVRLEAINDWMTAQEHQTAKKDEKDNDQ